MKNKIADFDFEKESELFDSYEVKNIAECEFLALSPNNNVVYIRSNDLQIDLLSTATL